MSEDRKYPIKRKGLFVIIANKQFRNGPNLNYGPDVAKLMEIFDLSDEKRSPKSNLKLGLDLTFSPDDKRQESSRLHFDTFMSNAVLGYNDHKPAFIMCFLMSHGDSQNCFQLSAVSNVTSPEEACGSGGHFYTGKCELRNYYKTVINKISETAQFRDIPRIFFLQVCRGTRHGTWGRNTTIPPEGGGIDTFYERHTDQYILFPSVYSHPSFVSTSEDEEDLENNGSVLIQALVNALTSLKSRVKSAESKFVESEVGDFPLPLPLPEDLVGGWMEDIGTDIQDSVSTELWKEIVAEKARFDMSQPESINTLRKKLSWLDILASQGVL